MNWYNHLKVKELPDNVQTVKFTNTQIKWLSYDYRWSVIIWLFCQKLFLIIFSHLLSKHLIPISHVLLCYIWLSTLLAAVYLILNKTLLLFYGLKKALQQS